MYTSYARLISNKGIYIKPYNEDGVEPVGFMRFFLFTKSLSVSKNRYIMAIEVKFTSSYNSDSFLKVSTDNEYVLIHGEVDSIEVEFAFDITTAIKFAKTVRTEINKAKEVDNGNR